MSSQPSEIKSYEVHHFILSLQNNARLSLAPKLSFQLQIRIKDGRVKTKKFTLLTSDYFKYQKLFHEYFFREIVFILMDQGLHLSNDRNSIGIQVYNKKDIETAVQAQLIQYVRTRLFTMHDNMKNNQVILNIASGNKLSDSARYTIITSGQVTEEHTSLEPWDLNLPEISGENVAGIDFGGSSLKVAVINLVGGSIVRSDFKAFSTEELTRRSSLLANSFFDRRRIQKKVRQIIEFLDAHHVPDNQVITIGLHVPAKVNGELISNGKMSPAERSFKDTLEMALRNRGHELRFRGDSIVGTIGAIVLSPIQSDSLAKRNIIFNGLGTGLANTITYQGRLHPYFPEQAHWMSHYSANADGFFSDHLRQVPYLSIDTSFEAYAGSYFLQNVVKEKTADFPITIQEVLQESHHSIGRLLSNWLVSGNHQKNALAREVFRSFGKNLFQHYLEHSLHKDIYDWTILLSGGISQGEAGNLIVKGIRQAETEYKEKASKLGFKAVTLEIIRIEDLSHAKFSGAIGAAYLTLFEAQGGTRSFQSDKTFRRQPVEARPLLSA